ncbi:type IX secretion system membrane protein, PorP/SprF family [Ekhidna lutea]|uniref:Type IX secretion system membrane protein, PorP/SprF family n=1 Tax=Ekhidna lutea TaxID=447679 RepID=A0A239KR45_EKHLU|nr:type IX secretion system membrane protein PorP/SprF [Ekhidna lutea]SNT20867.1 type IX secretion system membrane protein, PorP/SprF family [Ekhidna lutea]
MKNLKLSLIVLSGLLASGVFAQQQAMFTQYMFNAVAINPGVVGTHKSLSVTALLREQWVGIEGAPSTQTLSVHSPLLNDRVGLGLLFVNDQIGITRQNSLFGAYAYRVNFGSGTLSLGLQAGFSNYKSNQNELNPNNPDMSLTENYNSGLKPNFGSGAYFYTDRLYLGFSVPMLVNHNFFDDGDSGKDQRKHYFMMAGYVIPLSSSLMLKPNILVKGVEGAPVEFDLNANLLIEQIIWVGVSYRSFDSIDALLELQINSQLKLGYAHDFTTSDLKRANRGTHEIMLNYVFAFKNKKTITPRYF